MSKEIEQGDSKFLTVAAEEIVAKYLDVMFEKLVNLDDCVEFTEAFLDPGIEEHEVYKLNNDTYFREMFLEYIQEQAYIRLVKAT